MNLTIFMINKYKILINKFQMQTSLDLSHYIQSQWEKNDTLFVINE